MPKRQKPAATQFSEKQLGQFIALLAAPRSQAGTGRFAKLHEKIRFREDHFHNLKGADQQLDPPYDDAEPYQSDVLRRTWVAGKARMVENPFRVRAEPPRKTPALQKIADDFEAIMNRGLELVQERQGFEILADLADGQWVQAYGVLHWQKADDIWPGFPERMEFDELPDEKSERERYRERREDEGPPAGSGQAGRRYVERSESRQERDMQAKALAGFPWYVEVLHPATVSFIEDKSLANGMAMVLTLREVPLIEYTEQLARADKRFAKVTSINQHAKRIRIYEEQDRPADWDPSGGDQTAWGRKVTVAQLWTRDEFYELVALASGGTSAGAWTLVKSFTHPYGMPPFALALADHYNHPDPALAFTPAMEGLYRLKPFHDRDMTLGRVIAEQIALPFYYVKQSDGAYMSDDEGKRIVFSKNALAAEALPPGAEIVAIAPQMNDAIIKFLELTSEQLGESVPETGIVEVGASTQPWTIRLAQDQSNAYIAQLKKQAASAIRVMVRNMQHCMALPADKGGYGRAVPVRMADGEIKALEPEQIKDLILQVDINPVSSAQRIANIEHGRQLLADPAVPYSQRQFLEQDMEVADVGEHMEEYLAETWFREDVEPGLRRQEVAKRYGARYVVGPDGVPIGADGAQVPPEEVLSASGVQVQQPRIDPSVVAAGQPAMPDLANLNVNGSSPVMGMPG